ncbi:MAG: beta-propeller domain-containing protein [Solirubrobacterales bacterium]
MFQRLKRFRFTSVIAGLTILGLCLTPAVSAGKAKTDLKTVKKPAAAAAKRPMRTFASQKELSDYIKNNIQLSGRFGYYGGTVSMRRSDVIMMKEAMPLAAAPSAVGAADQASPANTGSGETSIDYSKTNVQVEGVDEADFVKSDGKYLYVASGTTLFIVKAYPAGKGQIVSRITLKGSPSDLFINGNRMIVMGRGQEWMDLDIKLFDITDRAHPEVLKTIQLNGDYVRSRMIGDTAYLLISSPMEQNGDVYELPKVTINGVERKIAPNQIYAFGIPDYSYQYTRVMAINLKNTAELPSEKVFLTGTSQNVFASTKNIYMTNQKVPDYQAFTNRLLDEYTRMIPAKAKEIAAIRAGKDSFDQKLSDIDQLISEYIDSLDYDAAAKLEEKVRDLQQRWQADMQREREKTTITRLAVNGRDIQFGATGEVPGSVLNQFSMDEHNGYFRIATTSQTMGLFGAGGTRNNVYVLDSSLKMTGRLQGLAPNERIYSARFMGNRVYLVTFRQVDPLFVIDLTNPKKPAVLGKLKIPGYSDYLHPIDDKYLIGIGKEVAEIQPEPMPVDVSAKVSARMIMPPLARPQGLKIALFDVSDPNHPREISKYVVDGYSDSSALHDHRAFLYSREKNLMVLPVDIYEPYRIMTEGNDKSGTVVKGPWYGAFVFNVSPKDGIKLKGKIQHETETQVKPADEYIDWSRQQIQRGLYIEDVLLTVSDHMIKWNQISDLKEVDRVNLD